MPDMMFRMDAEIIDYHAPNRSDLLHSPDFFSTGRLKSHSAGRRGLIGLAEQRWTPP
jgi:hypothetical protein